MIEVEGTGISSENGGIRTEILSYSQKSTDRKPRTGHFEMVSAALHRPVRLRCGIVAMGRNVSSLSGRGGCDNVRTRAYSRQM